MIRYSSVCSGIEAASTAWHTLGWQPVFFSEIEPFPCSVLAHHWPHVPNLGDLTQHESWNHDPIDLLVGGTPCQAFSVAGLREGLADPRGNLTLTFLALVKRTRPRWVVWENVPGVLSDRTNAFGHFLSGLAELGYGWAYRVLDAQYFGVAQRRRRVFVVACAGADWRRAAAVLFEPDCLLRNPPPSRQAGQGFAHDVAPCIGASGRGFERGGDTRGQDPDVACLGHCESRRPGPEAAPAQPQGARATVQGGLPPSIVACLDASYSRLQGCSGQDLNHGHSHLVTAFGGNNRAGPIDAAAALNAKGGSGRMDFESETFITHSLRAEGFDASEDGTGRGTPLVPIAFPGRMSGTQCAAAEDVSPSLGAANPTAVAYAIQAGALKTNPNHGPDGVGVKQDVAYTLEARSEVQAVAFQPRVARNGRGYTGDIVNALQAQSGETGKGDAAPCVAVAFSGRARGAEPAVNRPERPPLAMVERTGALETVKPWNVAHEMRVRRLTPRECERLQGFPDDHTLVPHRGKPAADGPRYKAIGNSMAVPVMAWIGRRIQNLEKDAS